MPNIKKRTEARKDSLSLVFRFRGSEIQPGAQPPVANHILKSWAKGVKIMEKTEASARHAKSGVSRAKRREGLKRKGA
jgi:hypothetical protein